MEDQILILALHRVGKPPREATLRGLFTSERLLRFQVRLLEAVGFRFTTLREAMSGGGGRKAVITFDDGYLDNLTNALPVLGPMNVPATVFAITGDVGKRGCTWDEAGDKTPSDMLTWEQLRELAAKGWEIGAHADEHVHLAKRPPSEQMKAIRSSVRSIEERLGTEPISFAYPYGSYTEETKGILRSLRVRFAVTTRKPSPGELRPSDDHLELKRLAVGGWAWHHFAKVAIRSLAVIGFASLISGLIPSRTPLLSPIPQVFD